MSNTIHFRAVYLRAFLTMSPISISGCAGLVAPGEEAVYSRVPVDSVVHVEQRLPVARDSARVWLRGDTTSTGSSSNRPICNFEVDKIDREGFQFIEPGEFRIRRVQNMWTEIVRSPAKTERQAQYQLASIGGGDGGTPMIYEGYHFWFDSPEQPNVMRMTCIGVFAEMWEARPPTIAEVRDSLGRLATLELADVTVP